MKKMIDIAKTSPIEFRTYVFVKHQTSDKKYLFEIPEGLSITFGDEVLCDTIKGESRGLVVSSPFELDRRAADVLSNILGFYFPVKTIIARLHRPNQSQEWDSAVNHICTGPLPF